jgi:hypothetical protein
MTCTLHIIDRIMVPGKDSQCLHAKKKRNATTAHAMIDKIPKSKPPMVSDQRFQICHQLNLFQQQQSS